MKMIEKFNWGAALVMVMVIVFVEKKVDLIAFLWLPTFLTSVYGLPLWFDSRDRRLHFRLDQMIRDWRCPYGR